MRLGGYNDIALEALIGDDALLVDRLDKENAKRRKLTQSMTKEALAQIHSPQYAYQNAALVWLPKGHSGVGSLPLDLPTPLNNLPLFFVGTTKRPRLCKKHWGS